MGWTFTSKGGLSTKEFFERRFNCERFKVLDCATKANVAYIAAQLTPKDGRKPYVGALICLIERGKDAGYEFGYKDMDETMGPYYTDCPERILKLLTPLDEWDGHAGSLENARTWRQKCYDNLSCNKTAKAIKNGTVIKFATPIGFTNNFKHDTFKLDMDGRKERWLPAFPPGADTCKVPGGYMTYRITNWRQRPYKIVA